METWQLIASVVAVLGVWSGVLLWAIRWMLTASQRHIDQRFKVLETADQRWQDVDRELLKFKAELPREYVRREDWIRFGATIDTKLDRLGNKLDSLKEKRNAQDH